MWFRVDDSLAFHPKVVAARNPAMGLWVRAGSWCGQQLTDGLVPLDIARALGSKREIDALVDNGLWLPDGSGFRFHQWEGRNPTRSEVEAVRSSDRRRADLHRDTALRDAIRERDADRCRYCGVAVDFRARRGPTRGTYNLIDPTGPNTLDNLVVSCGRCTASDEPMTLLPPGSLGGSS
jgi:hypothetical protein